MDAGKAGQGSNGSQEPETFFDAKDDVDEELPQAEQVPGPGKITTLGRDAAQPLVSLWTAMFLGILRGMSLLMCCPYTRACCGDVIWMKCSVIAKMRAGCA